MKFREYDNLEPLTISAPDSKLLDAAIKEVAETNDIIDLQFATNTVSNAFSSYTLYSALLLVRPIKSEGQ